jgi:hypothetical protein
VVVVVVVVILNSCAECDASGRVGRAQCYLKRLKTSGPKSKEIDFSYKATNKLTRLKNRAISYHSEKKRCLERRRKNTRCDRPLIRA